MTTQVPGHDPLIGRQLGHYRILQQIGAGGMGEVYRAHDEHLDREVAIKVLHSGTLSDDSARKQFRKEALALSKLNHPNVATVHDFDTQQGVDFLVMEYISGTTVRDKLADSSLPEREILRLGTQLAEGLDAAHQHGVVHRDLKPSNLRLTDDGRLKILDFGLAKLRQSRQETITAETRGDTWAMAGTLPYMAPEQLLCGEIDARTDIHASGAVLYEMATGQRPFAEVAHTQLVGAILHQPPQPLSTRNPSLSPELARIITKCLEKEPDNRYQSAKELAIDLRRLEQASHFVAGSTETPKNDATALKSFPARNFVLAASALLVLIIAAVLYLRIHSQQKITEVAPNPIASIAVLPFADLSPNHDQEYLSDGLAEEILNDLAKIPDLKVVGRTSAFQFKGKNEDLRIIGKKLSVSNVLEGSIRKDGNHVRITAQLIKASDGFHLWSDAYDGDLKDLFVLQEDIASKVTSALQLKMGAHESPGPAQPAVISSPEAFQAFLQARYFYRMNDSDSSRKALDYANRAIQLDPAYAPSYALRAEIVLFAGEMIWMDYADSIQRSRQDAEKSIALAPQLPDGYRAVSAIQAAEHSNCPAAEKSLEKARELAPGDPDNLARAAMIAMCLGHQEEAAALYKQELALDPLRPSEYFHLGENLFGLGRYDEAQEALQKALDLNPHDIVQIHETRGEVLLAQGRPQEALAEMEKEPAGWYRDLGMALVCYTLGRRQESDAALLNLVSQHPNDAAYQIAQVYAYRGQVDQAFHWLDRAYKTHDPGLEWLKTDWKLKSLRNDPRYAQMLKKLNLAP